MADTKTALLARMEATLPELVTRNPLLDGVLGGVGDELAVADTEIEIWGLGGDGAEQGTAAVTAGSPVVTVTGALPLSSRFIVGDEFYLAGSTGGNAGRYQVLAVTSDTVITLTTNVPATETGIAFGRSTNRLARACLGLDVFVGGYEPTSLLRSTLLPGAARTHQLRGSRQGMTTELSRLTNTTAQLYDPTVPLVVVGTINAGGVRKNSALWSRDLTNAVWTGTATAVQNAVGVDGSANGATTLTDSTTSSVVNRGQTFAIPNDSAAHCVSVWIRKDSDTTRFPEINVALSGGTTAVVRGWQLNTQSGAVVTENTTGTGTTRSVDGGLWWIVEFVLNNNSTGNTLLTVTVAPAGGAVLGSFNAVAVGSCVVGQVQVELNAPFYSSPIFTTTAAVTAPAERTPLSAPYVLPTGVTTATGQPIMVSNSTLGKNGRYAIYAQPSASVLVLARKARRATVWYPYMAGLTELQFREDREAKRLSFRLINNSASTSQTVTCTLGVTGGVASVGVPSGSSWAVALANGVASWSWTVPAGQAWSGWVQVPAIHVDDEIVLTVTQSGGGTPVANVRLGYTGLYRTSTLGLAPSWKWGGLLKTSFPTAAEEPTAVVSQGIWPGWFVGLTDANAYENEAYTMASPSDFFVMELDHRNTLNYSESAIRVLADEHLAPVDADIILGFV